MAYLIAAEILLLIWVVFTFITPAGLGIVHLLLAVGLLLHIRGWVALDAAGDRPAA
jgi:hypothetical protein